mgnify:CR=1 FL=1
MLTETDFVNGFLSLIFVAISIFLGLRMILKYYKYKQKNLLYVGITWIIMCEPWWPHATSFLLAVFTGSGLDVRMFYFLAVTFVPIGLTAWLTAFTDFMNTKNQKLILGISIIVQVIFEIVFFYFLITDPSIIAHMRSPVDSENKPFILAYFITVILIFLITGIIFALKAIRVGDPKVKLKGKLILIAVLLYVFGGILDGAIAIEIIALFTSRIMLALSAVMFYSGFVLPTWLKKIFLKEER